MWQTMWVWTAKTFKKQSGFGTSKWNHFVLASPTRH